MRHGRPSTGGLHAVRMRSRRASRDRDSREFEPLGRLHRFDRAPAAATSLHG
ncbi:hypothetical protein A7982_12917 [Minicystis rosea]|nr:hypothetical protein A7982_12917 [Minicystis rosea]